MFTVGDIPPNSLRLPMYDPRPCNKSLFLIAESNMQGQILFAFVATLLCASSHAFPQDSTEETLRACECEPLTYIAKNKDGIREFKGNCLTADRSGNFFCYVKKDSGCCETNSARYPDYCVNYSLCDACDGIDQSDLADCGARK